MSSYGVPNEYMLGLSADGPGSLTAVPVPYDDILKLCCLIGYQVLEYNSMFVVVCLRMKIPPKNMMCFHASVLVTGTYYCKLDLGHRTEQQLMHSNQSFEWILFDRIRS